MITKTIGKHRPLWKGNVGRYLLVLYLIATGIDLLTGYDILILVGVLAVFAAMFILVGR